MKKSLEKRRKKDLDAYDEIDEINWKSQSNSSNLKAEELSSLLDFLENDEYKEIPEETINEDKTSYELLEDAEHSYEELKELWDASDLGEYTIDTPTSQKEEAEDIQKKL